MAGSRKGRTHISRDKWNKARGMFAGGATLSEIATRLHINESTLKSKCSREKWAPKRERVDNEVATEVDQVLRMERVASAKAATLEVMRDSEILQSKAMQYIGASDGPKDLAFAARAFSEAVKNRFLSLGLNVQRLEMINKDSGQPSMPTPADIQHMDDAALDAMIQAAGWTIADDDERTGEDQGDGESGQGTQP